MRISDWSSDVFSSDLFHGRAALAAPQLGIELKAEIAIAFRVIDPVFPHFHEQEKMNRLAEGRLHLLLGRLAHQADGLAALAEADRLVLLPADVDEIGRAHV